MKIPAQYDTPEVRQAVDEWCLHYKQTFKRPWSQLSATKAFNRLQREGLTAEDVVAAVDHSIEMGYRGIFRRPGLKRQQQDNDLPWVVDTRQGYKERWVVTTEEN